MADINGGKMDGFLRESYGSVEKVTPSVISTATGTGPWEVMGYHDYHEIPNYWNYAHLYVLEDDMFASVAAYSLPVHLYMVAAQSGGYVGSRAAQSDHFHFPEITELLSSGKITWKYYVTSGKQPDAGTARR